MIRGASSLEGTRDGWTGCQGRVETVAILVAKREKSLSATAAATVFLVILL